MSFHDVQFPTNISYGSSGGPGFKTDIIKLDSGFEERVSHWADPLRRYDAKYGIKSFKDLSTVLEFYIAREGAANTFRYKDFMDCNTSTLGLDSSLDSGGVPSWGDVLIGTGDGIVLQYQLLKIYSSGSASKSRAITKPVSGTVSVGVGGVELLTGWTCDYLTGIITFASAPSTAITAGCEFDVPVRFSSSADELFSITIDDFSNGSVDSLLLEEVKESVSINDGFFYGGAREKVLTADYVLSVAEARVYIIDATAGHSIFLPDFTNIPPGGPIFYIVCSAGTPAVKDSAGTTIQTLAANQAIEVLLSKDASGNKTWYLL